MKYAYIAIVGMKAHAAGYVQGCALHICCNRKDKLRTQQDVDALHLTIALKHVIMEETITVDCRLFAFLPQQVFRDSHCWDRDLCESLSPRFRNAQSSKRVFILVWKRIVFMNSLFLCFYLTVNHCIIKC